MDTTVRLYALSYNNLKTYVFAALFILGNLVLPQLCHLVPLGGKALLPIYFFTLIAAYKYGLYAGLLTAVFSPLCNYWLFGMPDAGILPVILTKSVLLATFAAIIASKFKKVSLAALVLIVLAYQLAGTGIEWLMVKNPAVAFQDFRLGFPGMLFQVFGGYLVLTVFSRKNNEKAR